MGDSMDLLKKGRDVEPEMDCFGAQNRMTDALDGVLSPKVGKAFERHLAHCTECETMSAHIRELITVLHKQPRSLMSNDLREDPLSFPIRRIRNILANPRATWKELPVAIRLLAEGVTIASVVILGIRLGPVAREMYEARMERRLQSMIAAEDQSNRAVPLSRGKSEGDDSDLSDEVANESDSDSSAGVDVADEVQVGKAEIWRFNLKTDAPTIVRGQILKALKETGVSEKTPGIGGVEAPGGIQFDLMVPQTVIGPLKSQLERLAGTPSENLPFSETFTWYKNRSKKPIPNGMSRVVIWLSQI